MSEKKVCHHPNGYGTPCEPQTAQASPPWPGNTTAPIPGPAREYDVLRMVAGLNTPQPPPKPSMGPAAWDLVQRDLERVWYTNHAAEALERDILERDAIGTKKYGQRLTIGDGRDSLVDAYQESLDLTVYLKKHCVEQERHGEKDWAAEQCYGDALRLALALRGQLLARDQR